MQRELLKNFELAAELGAEVVSIKNRNIAASISQYAIEKNVTSIVIGRPSINLSTYLFKSPLIYNIIKKISDSNIDLLVIS